MGTAVLMLPPLDFEGYRVEVLRFLRENAPARSVEVKLSADDNIRFWPVVACDLVDTATDIARFIVTLSQRQEAIIIVRGAQNARAPASSRTITREPTGEKRALPVGQCPACKRAAHAEELVSFHGRMLCLYCVELYNRNVQLRQKAAVITHKLAGAIRDLASRLDSHGCD
jgi:hypothetical protein